MNAAPANVVFEVEYDGIRMSVQYGYDPNRVVQPET
jgi:hypothetical protein